MGRGKLVFKGEEKKAKKKKTGSSKKKSAIKTENSLGLAAGAGEGAAGNSEELIGSASSSIGGSTQQINVDNNAFPIGNGQPAVDLASETKSKGPKIKSGQGLITTSQCVCQGHGTTFQTQLRAGDAIIARTQAGGEEMRVITMVLSDVSISLSSPFSSNLSTPTPFNYIKKPRDEKKEKAAHAQLARREQEEVETRAMGTYGNKGEIIYREKTEHGGYRIRKERATTDMSRSDLLAVRAKKKSDRYC
mmetsp:Transcript_12076/g.20934  ORF Transcript_12076/g.20934 Transcript_12076/m.20934 type:complete len:248 (-) Transcript_12076:164-907(-)|eukprot:CAMPEP_0183753230 /NCGR_PEP_ID=MMETSP0739-20130205/2811_1 /TAXON_ID=385413 /ORGANISM="Thalassiosira miniscula, Strain CCMP1093" /LENGTH=247 /DNA_ID=CAMNT_0025989685 /DNA_START=38 /DNA_END=781 /DNA_ORIENTATION=+